jgi:hypothetical protein
MDCFKYKPVPIRAIINYQYDPATEKIAFPSVFMDLFGSFFGVLWVIKFCKTNFSRKNAK